MGLTWTTDVSAGAWLSERIVGFGTDVGSVVPHEYEAYARVPHHGAVVGALPAEQLQALTSVLGRHTGTGARTWFAVWDGWGVLHGSPAVSRMVLPGETAEPVRGVAPAAVLSGPRLELPHREYVLLHGAVDDAVEVARLLPGQSPSIWWSEDRAWCVATEIDLAWTFVGAGSAVVGDVIADRSLDARPVDVTDPLV